MLGVVVAVVDCAAPPAPARLAPATDAEMQVYSAALPPALGDSLAGFRYILDSTAVFTLSRGDWRPRARAAWDSMPGGLPERLAALSADSRPMRRKGWPTWLRVVDRATWLAENRMFGPYERASLYLVSPVAFSADSMHALVYIELPCPEGLCGGGSVHWMVRAPDGQWRLRDTIEIWVG
jgi:hypothetical protein